MYRIANKYKSHLKTAHKEYISDGRDYQYYVLNSTNEWELTLIATKKRKRGTLAQTSRKKANFAQKSKTSRKKAKLSLE